MAIVNILQSKKDGRKEGEECKFNGYLEDYLTLVEDEQLDKDIKEIFQEILKEDNQVKICVDLKLPINKKVISNQIIRYKDSFKLEGSIINIDYIIYGNKGDKERALIILPYTTYSYLYAKGIYYCMTEPDSEFAGCKNEIISISSDNKKMIIDAYKNIYSLTAGSIQRNLDGKRFNDYELLKIDAIRASEELCENVDSVLALLENKTEAIHNFIVKWFLLKKVLYVQYMVNKNMLNNVHEGNVRKQRNQAKLNSDEIKFVSYSEMWRK